MLIGRDESSAYLAGLGTVGMEVYEQVSNADAVIVPAAGQFGLLAGTAAALKHLNPHILVIVSTHHSEARRWQHHAEDTMKVRHVGVA